MPYMDAMGHIMACYVSTCPSNAEKSGEAVTLKHVFG